MKHMDEFRSAASVKILLQRIRDRATKPCRLMEFCGGHTHALFKFGLRQLLPAGVQLLSGPGCPVCVTACADLDRAIALAFEDRVVLATFGDMLRVPGSQGSLQEARARGADVRIVYSTLDALAIAREHPDREVVFLGVGFETTAPTVAASIVQAQAEGLKNFSVLSLHKLTPPAMQAILQAGEVALSGIIGPGHVTTIIGSDAWAFLPRDYGIPCAVAGFEPVDMLQAIDALVTMNELGKPAVHNAYARSVRPGGNPTARDMMERVFRVASAAWRGLGEVPDSGLAIGEAYRPFDALTRFQIRVAPSREPAGCKCAQMLRGVSVPPDCALFGRACTPAKPVGPCMVSGEGVCAAYMQYQDHNA